MGFDNTQQYPNRKDWRQPYRRSGRFDRTCRPGGSCPWCIGNRTHQAAKAMDAARLPSAREAGGVEPDEAP